MIQQTDLRLLNLMLEKVNRLIGLLNTHSLEEIESNFVYTDTIQFEFEKLYEDSNRLSTEFRITHANLPINELRAIRNRVAHDYETVSVQILINTIQNDLPLLKEIIENLISSGQ